MNSETSSHAPSDGPSPELFFETAFAHQRTAALKAAVELDVFSAIHDGAHTAGRLAEARSEFEAAAKLSRNAREVEFLLTRAAACD